jgi:hypothetical protein
VAVLRVHSAGRFRRPGCVRDRERIRVPPASWGSPERRIQAIRSARAQRCRWADGRYSMSVLLAPAVSPSCLYFRAAGRQRQVFALNRTTHSRAAGRWMEGAEWEAAVGRATSRSASLWQKAREVRAEVLHHREER